MVIDKQCFTKIVKDDFGLIGKYIILPTVVVFTMLLAYNAANIDFAQILKFISDNMAIVSILIFDIGLLILLGCFFKDPINPPHSILLLILIGSIPVGLFLSSITFIENIIPHIANIIFLLITIPLMHGYIKCKKV
jgi:hypothetical protein